MEEGASRFTEVITEDKVQEIAEEPEVSDSEEEKKRQATLWKEKRDTRTATCFSASRLHRSSAARLVSGLSTPFSVPVPSSSAPSPSAGFARSAGPVSGLSAPSASAGSVRSTEPVSGSSALSAFAESAGSAGPVSSSSTPSASAGSAGSTGPVSGLSTPSASTRFAVPLPSLSAPSASAPSTSFGFVIPVLGSSTSAAPVFQSLVFSASVVIPNLERQKLIKLNRREKRTTSEELAPAFISLLLFEPPILFSVSRVGKKRLFNEAFDINYRPLANNPFGEDVNLSFTCCQCLPFVETNRPS